jgi:hypothetical protein
VNLALSLLYAAERMPNAEALAGEGMRLNYRQLRTRAAEIAAGLTARGVERGDRVACVLPNEPEMVELYWGTQWLGACFVPLSHRASQHDLDYCIGLGRGVRQRRIRARGAGPGRAHSTSATDPALHLGTGGQGVPARTAQSAPADCRRSFSMVSIR